MNKHATPSKTIQKYVLKTHVCKYKQKDMNLQKLNANLNNHGNLIQRNDTNSKLQKVCKNRQNVATTWISISKVY